MATKPVAADVEAWATERDAAAAVLGGHFARSKPRERAAAYLRGLLSDVDRKNGWPMAERAGGRPTVRRPAPAGPGRLVGRRRPR